jgi:CMP/dCMP kinase
MDLGVNVDDGSEITSTDRVAPLIIAVDGPAGSGKSSVAKGVARVLNLQYLDTGAMHRGLTWWLLAHGISTADATLVVEHMRHPSIKISTDPTAFWISVDDTDVTKEIRTREVSNAVSGLAKIPQTKTYLVKLQQAVVAQTVAGGNGVVVEGRDAGTVIVPEALVKIFLSASAEARALRRAGDIDTDPGAIQATIHKELVRRDRDDAPHMVPASDAVRIDSTSYTLEEIVVQIVALARIRRTAEET